MNDWEGVRSEAVARPVRPARASRGAPITRASDGSLSDKALHGLVARARANDPDAWDVLYRRAYRPLFGYARRRLPSDGHAEEAVSETFARAYDAIGRYRPRGAGFDAWLFGIMRNVVLESYRVLGRVVVGARDGEDAGPEPLEKVLADEEVAAVRTAFERLSPEDREILELRVVAGLDSREVAGVLGKRPGAVRMAQSRALSRLRAILDGKAPA
jgi:RNA polymerase sigma-70 factor, ECF subfamily